MDSGTLLAILGVLATVVFGGLSIYLFMKRRYPGQITFVVEDCLGLFESIVKHFPELAVSYNDSPVGEGIVLLKGALLNTGSRDIAREMVEGKLTLALPKSFTWLQAKVVSSSPSVEAQIEQTSQSLTFDTGLFRCQEFVRFECLVEVPMPNDKSTSIESRLLKKLDVSHRIADTQKVHPMHLPPPHAVRRTKRRIIPLVGMMLMGVVLAVVILVKGIPPKIHYHITNENGDRIEVAVKAQNNGEVLIRGVKDKAYRKRLPASSFFGTPDLDPKMTPDRAGRLALPITAVLYILGPIVLCGIMFRGQRKARQIRGLLGLLGQDDDRKKEDPTTESSATSG